jgi:hypothetical protein
MHIQNTSVPNHLIASSACEIGNIACVGMGETIRLSEPLWVSDFSMEGAFTYTHGQVLPPIAPEQYLLSLLVLSLG